MLCQGGAMQRTTLPALTLRELEPRSFDSLPPELVSRISCFLGPRDVIHLRLVSKLFHGITYDPIVWKTIYANACLPRPPGPFPSQSSHFLEQTLIRSARLTEFWTTKPIQTVLDTQIRLQGSSLGHPRIIGGRWLLAVESHKQIVLYDIETHSRCVLWEDDMGLITSWDACSVISAGELLVYVMVRKNAGRDGWRAPWKLLEFRSHGESGNLTHSISLDVPTTCYWQSICLVADKTPFLYIVGRHLIFDTRTRTFYKFPEFSSELEGIHAHQCLMTPRRVLLTNTHIIAIFYHLQDLSMPSSMVEPTVIQAFTLPTGAHPASNETGILHRTHEGIIPDCLANLVLIRNSIVDPTTGHTSLKFLRLQPEGDCLSFSCVDLALPRSLPDTVLPMSIKTTEVFTVKGGMYDPCMSPCGYFIETSDDGHVRGCCRTRVETDGSGPPDSRWFTKFTLDATGDECVATAGRVSLPRWVDGDDPPSFSTLSFDGVVGRFCYLKNGHNWRLRGFVDVVVADIK